MELVSQIMSLVKVLPILSKEVREVEVGTWNKAGEKGEICTISFLMTGLNVATVAMWKGEKGISPLPNRYTDKDGTEHKSTGAKFSKRVERTDFFKMQREFFALSLLISNLL
jgi:hypothetical protein